jgi:hypothetical protein
MIQGRKSVSMYSEKGRKDTRDTKGKIRKIRAKPCVFIWMTKCFLGWIRAMKKWRRKFALPRQ